MARALVRKDEVFPVKETELDLPFAPDPEAVYYVRMIDPDTFQELRRPFMELKFNKRIGRQELIFPEDKPERAAKAHAALLQYALVRWEGVVDGNRPVPCTDEYKDALPPPIKVALVDLAVSGVKPTQEERRDSFREAESVV